MTYVVVKLPTIYHQMSLEELLFGEKVNIQGAINPKQTDTRTYEVNYLTNRLRRKLLGTACTEHLIQKLEKFNAETEGLRQIPRKELFREFYIPKKSGGLRKIDAPEPELMTALRNLKTIFEEDFRVLYHTSAFAYIKKRSTLDAVKRHQQNESRWFGKYDLSDFFGSTTLDFVMKMFSMIFPFSDIVATERGRSELEKALELAFLDGGLPQGTPISPLITNVMMIPIDYKLSNGLRDFQNQRYIYTRYADDFIVSSRFDFDVKEVEDFIVSTLNGFGAPFTLNAKKTRYGSSSGRNWNLGVMLNKDNQITIGHKKKRQFQAMIHSFVMDTLNGIHWEINDIQVLEGYRNYYRMVERDSIDGIIDHINSKLGVNAVQMMKDELRA